MRIKISLTLLFTGILIIRLLINWLHALALGLMTALAFFSVTRDRANAVRLFVCSFSAAVPIWASPLPYLASVLLNDEALRHAWRWRFMVFTGCDGSGKSSHARETARWLREQGQDAIHFHFFKNPILTRLSMMKKALMKVPDEEALTYTRRFREHVSRHFLPKLRPLVCFLDNWAYISLVLLRNFLKGRWVVVDRYFYDFYVRFKCLGYPMPGLLRRFYTCLVPRPALVVFMEVRPELSLKRRHGEHPLWYYVTALAEYRALASELRAVSVNTEKPFTEAQAEINRLVESILKLRRP